MDAKDLQWLDEEILLDTSENQRAYLVRSESGKYLRLSASAFHLARCMRDGLTAEELAEAMNRTNGGHVEPKQVEKAFQEVKRKLETAEAHDAATRSGFWVRFEFLPDSLVVELSSVLTWIYRPWVVRAFVVFTVFVTGLAVALRGNYDVDVTTGNLMWAYVLYFVSLLLHELGHSSACLRYGARPSGIGAGVYLVFPVLYSDVSAAWRLTRWQRTVVDLAGIYLQSVVGAAFILLFLSTQWPPWLLAASGILTTIMFSLNPVFRFDGYWAIADSLGVTNLGQQKSRVLRHFWGVLRGRSQRELPWPRWLVVVLLVYSVLSFVVIAFFMWRMFPMLANRLLQYPEIVGQMIDRIWTSGELPEPAEIRAFLGATLATVLACVMMWRLVGGLGKRSIGWLRNR